MSSSQALLFSTLNKHRIDGGHALFAFALVVCTFFGAGCKEQISGIGGPFFSDKITEKTLTLIDSNTVKFANYVQPIVQSSVHSYNVNAFGTTLFLGKVTDAGASENVQAWSLLRFQFLSSDTLANVDSVRLQLRLINYRYGDLTNTHLDFSVYAETNQRVNDSTKSLTMADLSPSPLGTFVGDIMSDSTNTIYVKLDTSLYKHLDLTTAAFVLVPNAMSNVRGFGSSENSGFQPQMEYNVHQAATSDLVTTRPVVFDFPLVLDASVAPAGEFSLRGSLSRREFVRVDVNRLNTPADSISQFSTVNSAVLSLRLDRALTRHSDNSGDTAGPVVVQLFAPLTADSTAIVVSNGTVDPVDPTLYHFQIRTMVEQWLRDSTKNFGFELRSGYVLRTFGTRLDAVDDVTLNRWTFYGADATDPAKRPVLVLTYSILK